MGENKKARNPGTGAILAFVLIFQLFGAVVADQCYSFAGGSVYPQETTKSSGHTLQWTKAMSKFRANLL